MAKWVAFDAIEIQQSGPQSYNIIKVPNVPVNVDAVVLLVPTNIPSDLTGPDGKPLPRPGVVLSFGGLGLQGPGVIVEGTREEILWKLENGPFIVPEKPEENLEGMQNIKKPTLKLIKPV